MADEASGDELAALRERIRLLEREAAEREFRLDELSRANQAPAQQQTEEELRQFNLQLERKVAERTSQLRAARDELEAFAYSVSHDLRAPLRHIDGFVELLRANASGLDASGQHYLANISGAAQKMGRLVDDLLSFSRMGHAEMTTGELELRPLVEEVIQDLRPDVGDRTVRWVVADLPSVHADRAMLRIVLSNLLSNALKFTCKQAEARIEIGAEQKRREIVVYVRDNGVGYNPKYEGKLFRVFQRLHGSEFEGTGIGLANVKRIVGRHGGRVWSEGGVDAGATFRFSLPLPIGAEVYAVQPGKLVPPIVAPPRAPAPFAGQQVRIAVNAGGGPRGPISGPFYEVKEEFEAATGATLVIDEVVREELLGRFLDDLDHGGGTYDSCIASASWLGELVSRGAVRPYEDLYGDPRFPAWDVEDVLPRPRALLRYGGHAYMVANDHDCQLMYYRRDLLADPVHRAAFRREYGRELSVPATFDEVRDVAAYFQGKDLAGDGAPGYGVTLHHRWVGSESMMHYQSISAPFVIGPTNPSDYWFEPGTMRPLIDSPGHLRALETLVDLLWLGAPEMLGWDQGKSWDCFLRGRAALAFTFGDLGGLAQDPGSAVRGRLGVAPIPGTRAYFDVGQDVWIRTAEPNRVGNHTGGSWGGVISGHSRSPEATYFLLALLATKPKSTVFAARGWDGVEPGRFSHFLPPHGTALLADYSAAGWDEQDLRGYLDACFENFNCPLHLPCLRLPGADEYWTALDRRLYQAVCGRTPPEQALRDAAAEFEEITDRRGRARQASEYERSLAG